MVLNYELIIVRGATNGQTIFAMQSASPFIAFSVGDIVNFPNGTGFAIKEIHHMFLPQTQDVGLQKVALVV